MPEGGVGERQDVDVLHVRCGEEFAGCQLYSLRCAEVPGTN